MLGDPSTALVVSALSAREIATKHPIGRLATAGITAGLAEVRVT